MSSSSPNYYSEPHLERPSRWGLRLQHTNLGGHSSVQSTHSLKRELSAFLKRMSTKEKQLCKQKMKPNEKEKSGQEPSGPLECIRPWEKTIYRMWSEPRLWRELQSFHGLYKDEVVYLCHTLIFFGRICDNRVPFFITLLFKTPPVYIIPQFRSNVLMCQGDRN